MTYEDGEVGNRIYHHYWGHATILAKRITLKYKFKVFDVRLEGDGIRKAPRGERLATEPQYWKKGLAP